MLVVVVVGKRNSAAAALCAGASARADTVLLHDTFDTENGGVGRAEYSGFSHWSAANIDLLAPGYFFGLCQSAGNDTPCLDMECSGNGSITTLAAYDLAPGFATVQFDLAGDQRGQGPPEFRDLLMVDVRVRARGELKVGPVAFVKTALIKFIEIVEAVGR